MTPRSGRARRAVLGATLVALLAALLLMEGSATGTTNDLVLPRSVPGRRAALVARVAALGQLGPVENHAPGPVNMSEMVTLGIRPDGSSAGVRVRQRLVVDGTGDFILEVPMDATDVAPVARELGNPGLRQGTVVWEGFAGGRRELAATVTLQGDAAAARFPVEVDSSRRDHSVALRISNRTTIRVPVETGVADPTAVASALDAARAAVQAGGDPAVERDGIPATIAARGPTASATIETTVPVRVLGSVTIGRATHAVDAVLAKPAHAGDDIVLTGRGPVHVDLSVEPVGVGLGDVPTLSSDAAPDSVADAFTQLEAVLVRSLRKADYDAFVPGVPTTSAVRFAVTAAPARRIPDPDEERQPNLLLAIAMVVGTVILVGGAASVWARH